MKVLPYGERGAYVDLEIAEGPDRASRTHALASVLRASFPAADVVAGAGVVAVFGADLEDVRSALERGSEDTFASAQPARTHEIPVRYDGPDLDDVALALSLSREAIIALHAGRDYTVEVVGFLPGFAYMGPLDPRLIVPRRPAPRPRVPAGTLAIAGAFTGIYPLASPGGWSLLGASLGPLPFDPARPEPFLFAPGDRVRFVPVDAAGEGRREGDATPANAWAPNQLPAPRSPNAWAPNESPAAPAVIVGRNPGLATVQDAGRLGLLGSGMPPSGPLDPDLHAAANVAAGNAPGAAAIELLSGSLDLTARGDVLLSIDGESPVALRDGESLRVPPARHAVRYIALAGGIDVPVVVGARATLLTAKIGGIEGRVLRRGDVLSVRASAAPATSESAVPPTSASAARAIHDADATAPIDIDPGPHLDRFPSSALDVLLASEWHLTHLVDRTGVRLAGARIPRAGPDLAAPVPMRRGAVQITTDGTPIVLGPDHPTTGGYPVLAVVRPASFGVLAQKRPGDPLRFRLVSR